MLLGGRMQQKRVPRVEVRKQDTNHLILIQTAIIKQARERCWRGRGGYHRTFSLPVEVYIGLATMENSMEVPQKTENRTILSSSNPTSGYLSESIDIRISKRHPPSHVNCSTIAKMWKKPNWPSADERVKKMWYTRTMEYYSAFKKKEILPHVTTWINLETLCQVK